MIQIDEDTSDWSVLLALTDKEASLLLSIVLDGFGYKPLECDDRNKALELLSNNSPFVAIVDTGLPKFEDICNMVSERENISLFLLTEDNSQAEEVKERYKADACETLPVQAEQVLKTLRILVQQKVKT